MGTGMTERLHLWAFSGCLSENKQKQIYALVFIEYKKKKVLHGAKLSKTGK